MATNSRKILNFIKKSGMTKALWKKNNSTINSRKNILRVEKLVTKI